MKVHKIIDPRWVKYGHQRHADSAGIKELLGLDPKGHIPAEGMPPKVIQGVTVWIKPLDPKTSRRRVHRVWARCPDCGAEMSVGRLHQHVCK